MWKQTTLQESTDFSSGSTRRLKWCHWQLEEGVLHPDKFKLDLVVSGTKKGVGRLEPRQKLDHMGDGVGDCHLVKEPTLLQWWSEQNGGRS